jgi:hypothetical protein
MWFSQTLLNWWITCTHYGWGPQIFQKNSRSFQKPSSQKTDIIWKHLLYVCHLTLSCKRLSSLGTLEMQSPHAFWRLETIKHDTLIVSNSIALYQKYVNIKPCLARRYISRAWRQVKMKFIPAPGKVNYNQAKAYCPIILLSVVQKTWKNWLPGILRMQQGGMSPTSIPNCLQTTEVHRITLIQKGVWAFLDIEGASDSTSCDIIKAAKWHGLGDKL